MSTLNTRSFHPAEYLDSPEAIDTYMTDVLETGDPSFVADAIDVIARARGKRESLVMLASPANNLSPETPPPNTIGA